MHDKLARYVVNDLIRTLLLLISAVWFHVATMLLVSGARAWIHGGHDNVLGAQVISRTKNTTWLHQKSSTLKVALRRSTRLAP